MKKFTKFLVVALSLVLLVGAIVGVSASAASTPTYEEKDGFIISTNVSYAEKLQLYIAIDPLHANFQKIDKVGTTNADTGTVKYATTTTYEDGIIDSVTCNVDGQTYNLSPSAEKTTLPNGREVYTVRAPGIAPKNMLAELNFTVKISYEAITTTTVDGGEATITSKKYYYYDTFKYSVAEYFFERLYDNGIVNATDAKSLAQKELYAATLAYAEAAQDLFDADAALQMENMIYVWGDKALGMVEKGSGVELNDTYSFEYYDYSGVTGSDITGTNGIYTFNSSTKIEMADEIIKDLPDGALTFGDYAEGAWTANEAGSALVGFKGQNDQLVNTTVDAGAEKNGTIKNLVWNKYGKSKKLSSNAMHWMLIENNSDVDSTTADLIFEMRMRYYTSNGSFNIRFYKDRTAAAGNGGSETSNSSTTGGRVNLSNSTINGASTGVEAGDWFTLKLIVNGTNVDFYINGVYSSSKTLPNAGTDAIQFTLDSDHYVDMEIAYVYCGAAYEGAPSITAPEATRANCDIPAFAKGTQSTDVAQTGSYVLNASEFTDGYTALMSETVGEVENTYMQLVKTEIKKNQPIYRIYNTTNEDKTDTVVFEGKFRAIDPTSFADIDITLRKGDTRVYRFYFTINDAYELMGGHFNDATHANTREGIDCSEWFTIRIEYTASADAYSAENLCARVWINDVELEDALSHGQFSSTVYAKASEIDNAGVIFSSQNTGVIDMDDLYFGHKADAVNE